MEPELTTLERAVTLAQQSECVKTQLPIVRGEPSGESSIEAVKGNKLQSKLIIKISTKASQSTFSKSKHVWYMWKIRLPHAVKHSVQLVRDAVCRKCGKI